MSRVAVVVPARNASGTIARTLEGVAGQDLGTGFDVIVVDNGSHDDTAAVATRALPSATVVRKEPGRVGSARNRGVAETSAERIAFIDADCVPTPGWLREGVESLNHADLVQGAVQPDQGAARDPFDRTVTVPRETGLYETANLFVRRETFEEVGGFIELVEADISAPFGEDVWFAWRARRMGARTGFCEKALAYHAVFPRSMHDFVKERERCEHFPTLVSVMPELRDAFLYRRWFLTRRTAAFDAAIAGVLLSLRTRSALPLLMAAPYARMSGRDLIGWRRRGPRALAGNLWADAVAFSALLRGSVRTRTPVL
jgi:glycosyltransferase involved in cell wall biosynthesis